MKVNGIHAAVPGWARLPTRTVFLSGTMMQKRFVPVLNQASREGAGFRRGLIRAVSLVGVIGGLLTPSLTALQWEPGEGYRRAQLSVPESDGPGFTERDPAETGVLFTNKAPTSLTATNRILENGSGVALGDVDGDGRCDIYLCRIEGPNRLYRNLGEWQFEEITDEAGVVCPDSYSTGAILADVTGNRSPDLLVSSIDGGTRLWINDGEGRFNEKKDSGLDSSAPATSMALADINGNGRLDLYVTHYRKTTVKDSPPGLNVDVERRNGEWTATPEGRFNVLQTGQGEVALVELGEPDALYVNRGGGRFDALDWTDGTFRDASGTPLKAPPKDWGLAVTFRDINRDGYPDLYVCNDFFYSRDRVWINDGQGGFHALEGPQLRNMSMSSMSVDFADINRDGHDDFFVADMLSRDHETRHRQREDQLRKRLDLPIENPAYRPEYPRNTLHLNRGDRTYAEIAQLSRVDATEWSWSSHFLDVDLDGYEDLLVTTGHGHFVLDADVLRELAQKDQATGMAGRIEDLDRFPPLRKPNVALRNQGDLTFEKKGADWGFDRVGVSHGMAAGDLDRDGDLDLVVNNQNEAASLYRNDATASRIGVRLKGNPPNTEGIGARVTVEGGPVLQSQEMMAGGRYLSSDQSVRVFAAGEAEQLTIRVQWPSGHESVIPDAHGDAFYEIREPGDETPSGAGRQAPRPKPESTPSWPDDAPSYFEDVSALLNHRHRETEFDDFIRQPLLPRKLSRLGPGVAWYDLDRDGWDDLVVGAGRGGELTVFRNHPKGGFSPVFGPVAQRDQTTVLGWNATRQDSYLLVGSSNYEDGTTEGASVWRYDLFEKEARDLLPQRASSPGPMALADVDLDGDLDLFVGGRVIPGRYPEAASSSLYRNHEGQFELDSRLSQPFQEIGLVSGAVFGDMNRDGLPDLILACEWGPVRVFQNVRGEFQEVTDNLGLGQYRGWWNGVTTGDLNGNGRLDLIATNWGRNSPYERYRDYPLQVYYGDLTGNKAIEIFEAYYEPDLEKVVPWRRWDQLARVLPPVRKRVDSFQAYGRAGLPEILGDSIERTQGWMANTLQSMVFFNRSNGFEAQPLPIEAQFAPAFDIGVGDYNGDGHEDLFLSQNFFGVRKETSRYDAGRGLWLENDGQGEWDPVPGSVSGVQVYGEQRGSALGDFDRDGRLDLVVTQNNGPTKLYRNRRGDPGLRVRLHGPAGNPYGVGAQIRLVDPGGAQGPVREVKAGSGYWSQESVTQVFGTPRGVSQIWIRWPGDHVTLGDVPPGANEIVVDPAGNVSVVR